MLDKQAQLNYTVFQKTTIMFTIVKDQIYRYGFGGLVFLVKVTNRSVTELAVFATYQRQKTML